MNAKLAVMLITSLAAGAAACGPTVVSHTYPGMGNKKDLSDDNPGIVYYLPKKRISIKVVRALTDKAGLVRKAKDAESKMSDANQALQDAKRSLAAAKSFADSAEGDAVGEAKKRLALAETAVRAATKQADAATADYNSAMSVLLAAGEDQAQFLDQITLALLPAEPDPRHQFVADLNHWPNRDDELTLATTPSGLLTTANVVAADRTGDILIQVASLASEIAKAVMVERKPKEPEAFTPKAFTYEDVFDPAAPAEIARVNTALVNLGTTYRVCAGVDGKEDCPLQSDAGEAPDMPPLPEKIDGLVYRTPLPYRIALLDCTGACTALRTIEIDPPNGGPLAIVPFQSGLLVRTKYDVAFTDGMLTSRNATRPSEIFGVVTTLTGIAKEIVSIPAEMLQLKVDYASKDEALAASQKSIVEAQRDILKVQQEIDTLKANPASPAAP